jgi:hypothetical protein
VCRTVGFARTATDGAATTDEPRTRVREGPLCRLDVDGGAERALPCVRPLPGRFPGAGRPGKGGCGDGWAGGSGERDACRAGGRSGRGPPARSWARCPGLAHPCREAAVLLASELFSDSMRYSRSGEPPETVTVAVTAGGGTVRVEVADRSGPGGRSCVRLTVARTAGGVGAGGGGGRVGAGGGAAGGRSDSPMATAGRRDNGPLSRPPQSRANLRATLRSNPVTSRRLTGG